MPNEAILAVLLGALLHASWNAAIKSGRNTFFDTILVATGAGLIAAVTLPFLALPARDSLPYLATSSVLQIVYFLLVAAAYRTADMSYAYPLMRGTPPLLVAAASGALAGEALGTMGWLGAPGRIHDLCARALAGGARGRNLHARLLRPGALGDDPRADCRRRGAARDLHRLRHGDLRPRARGTCRALAPCRWRRHRARRRDLAVVGLRRRAFRRLSRARRSASISAGRAGTASRARAPNPRGLRCNRARAGARTGRRAYGTALWLRDPAPPRTAPKPRNPGTRRAADR